VQNLNLKSRTSRIRPAARKLLTGSLALLALTALACGGARPASAGRVAGPARDSDVLGRGDVMRYQLNFRGGETAQVWAVGDGDIDLYVYDEYGNLVDEDVEADSIPVCRFRPLYTGRFIVRVVNAAPYAVDYTLHTN
jgi:hypothetical protein